MNWTKIVKAILVDKIFFCSWIDKLPLITQELPLLGILSGAEAVFKRYGRLPTIDELRYNLTNSDLADVVKEKALTYLADAEKVTLEDNDINALDAILAREITQRGIEKFTLDVAQNINTLEYEQVYDKLKNFSAEYRPFGSDTLGVDLANLPRTLSMIKYHEGEKIPSGLDAQDDALYGGFGVKELTCYMAHSGKGKTALLVNAMYGAMLNGANVLYVSLEMSERDILRRFYRRVTYKSKHEFHSDEKQWTKHIDKFFKLTKSVGRVIYYPTGTCSAFDIEVLLDKLKNIHNFEPKLLIIDHLDLVKPPKVNYRTETHTSLKLITDAVRNIALTRNIAVVTATQATRASFSKVKLTQADIGDSYGKVQSSDVVIALCQTEEELENKRMRLVLVKNRDYVGGKEVEVYIDLDKMLVTDLTFARQAGWITV